MYKVIGKENDMFKVLDLDEGTEELLSASELVLGLGQAEIEGCQHSEHGIEVWYDGVEKYEIPIEVWAPVSAFNVKRPDGSYRYMVSNLGRVKISEYYDSIGKFHKLHELRSTVTRGYAIITPQIDRFKKHLRVHILVSTAFIYNPHNLSMINHKNEDKLDNRAFNLEWCTNRYNINYGTANLRRSRTKGGTSVRQYAIDGKLVAEHDYASAAAKTLGLRGVSGYITLSCSGVYNIMYGFVWRSVEDDELFEKTELERKAIIATFLSSRHIVTNDESGNLVAIKQYVVRQYTLDCLFLREFLSVKDAALSVGAFSSGIVKACYRERKTCSGFIWRYAHDDEFADRPENVKAIEEWRKTHSV